MATWLARPGLGADSTRSVLGAETLAAFVRPFLNRRHLFLAAARRDGSPLYLIEEPLLQQRAAEFLKAFAEQIAGVRVFYALKSNPHPAVIRPLVAAGLGLDVSSGRELQLALGWSPVEILFSGPGKTDEELRLAVGHARQVTVLMDSFGELERLSCVAASRERTVRAGVRLCVDERGLWRKFGIPLRELEMFLARAAGEGRVRVAGLQFHTSWNLGPERQVGFLARLGTALSELPARWRDQIEFIDIGGGYWPPPGEWLHDPTGAALSPTDPWAATAAAPARHHQRPAAPIEDFAARIADAVAKHIYPHLRCQIYLEPGRWLCNDAMHILLTVVDRKCADLVITDGGTNMIGWERFESDYFPIINLSRPALAEHPCLVLGSLCTPHDVWGYHYCGSGIAAGDILLVPTQGAYTYSLRQEFIKPIPRAILLNGEGRSGD